MASAIKRCFIHKAGNSPWTMVFFNYMECLRLGGEHFVLKVRVFKALAVAVRERDRGGLRLRQPGKRLGCSSCQDD